MGSFKTGGSADSDTGTDDTTSTRSGSDIDDENDVAKPHVPPDSCPYSESEKVLAFHNLQIYEARVTKIDYRLKEWRCYVHYLGWNKSWDEWVGLDRLMKYTAENLKKQQALKKAQGTDKSTKHSRGTHIKPKSFNGARGRKRKSDTIKDKSAVSGEKLVHIQIPATLKKQLVDDCEFVTHLGKLVKLPRSPNIDDILKKYLDFRFRKDGVIDDSLGEVVKGLSCYFNKALPAMLLYKSERQQYVDTITNDVSPSALYGAEHLLRLFVRLPELLFHANIEEETFTELQQKFSHFLKFLRKNQSAFFLSSYHVPEDFKTCTNKCKE